MTTGAADHFANVIRFVAPLPPASLRGNSRAHWRTRHADADAYSVQVYAAYADGHDRESCYNDCTKCRELPWFSASVTYTWRYAGARPDLDNTARGVKVLQDAICCGPLTAGRNRWYLGLVIDDGDLEPITFRRERVAKKALEGIEVELRKVLR